MSPDIGLRPKRKVQRLQQIRFCYFPVYQNIIDGRPTKLMRAAGISTEGERPKIVGGPLVYVLESEEPLQRSLDSSCRKLYHFLRQSPR